MRGWPLLPVLGGKLVRVGSAVVEEGSWSAGVGAALAKLSCRVLDTSVIKLDVNKVRCCSSSTRRRWPGFADDICSQSRAMVWGIGSLVYASTLR